MSKNASPDDVVVVSAPSWSQLWLSEDYWAIWLGGLLIAGALWAVHANRPADFEQQASAAAAGTGKLPKLSSPLKAWIARPGSSEASWQSNPLDAIRGAKFDHTRGILGAAAILGVLFALATKVMRGSLIRFLVAFVVVFALATIAYVMASQKVVLAYNLEYVLWALVLGLIVSNTVGTPSWLRPAVRTELFIKTGLVLLGAEILFQRLLQLGYPGMFISWITTPIVLIATYIFGQRVLRIESKSLNMTICADMSVCGVSAAIATAAACRAKKEELTLAISLSLAFTAVSMIVMPAVIRATHMDEVLAGAWIGGTVDSTGAVAAAAALVGEGARDVAVLIKMIQNILIGVIAFGVAVYWVTAVERDPQAARPRVSEIWYRFPKFVLGFIAASLICTWIGSAVVGGEAIVDGAINTATKTLMGWCFCLAFVSIGLETNFRELAHYFRGGKPLVLYVVGQSLNLALTLFMAWMMFYVVFPGARASLGQ